MKYDIIMFQKLDQILQYKGTPVGTPMGYLPHLGTSYFKVTQDIGMMKCLALTSYLLGRITMTLISSFGITGCFQNVIFRGFDLLILNFELPSAFLYALYELFKKLVCFT